jgi:zinc protease
VHRPGSVQSNIWIGHVGITPDHQDYFPLQVLNKILGQGTDARLFQILREQKGWTYGAYSRFTRPQDVGYFAASAEVRTEVTDSAVAEMMHQLRRLRDEPVPAEEFNAAVSFLAGSFPLRIETPGQVASQVAQARLLGLPVEDVTAFRERILAVTPADVQRVAREHVRPEQAAIVVVGDATRVLAGLEPIAPIVLYDVEGARIERSALEVRGSFGAVRRDAPAPDVDDVPDARPGQPHGNRNLPCRARRRGLGRDFARGFAGDAAGGRGTLRSDGFRAWRRSCRLRMVA